MAETIVYRIKFSDEDEKSLREIISMGLKALDICQHESLKIPFIKRLNQLELMAINAIGEAYQNPDLRAEDVLSYIKAIENGDKAEIIKCAFELYRIAHYPSAYHKFLKYLHNVIGLASVAVTQAYPRIDMNAYSRWLHKSQTLNRDIWEAIHGFRNPTGLHHIV